MKIEIKIVCVIAALIIVGSYFFAIGQEKIIYTKKFSLKDVQGEFKSKQYVIGDHNTITIYDMPDRVAAHRCWVFTDDKISQSHMRCDSDPVAEYPEYAGQLDK